MGIPFAMNTTGVGTLRTDLIPDNHRVIGFNIYYDRYYAVCAGYRPQPGVFDPGAQRFWSALSHHGRTSCCWRICNVLLLKFEDIEDLTNKFSLKKIIEPRAIWFSLIMGIVFIGWPGILTYRPLYSIEVGLPFVGLFFLFLGSA